MNLMHILFNRRGQIGGRDYWIGCGALLFVGIILHLLAFGLIFAINPFMINAFTNISMKFGAGRMGMFIPIFLLIPLLFYPYLCLYTKRLRDIGVSAWWYIVALFVYCVGFWFLGIAIYGLLTLLQIDLSDVFMTSPLPGAPEDEIVARLINDLRKFLIVIAVMNAVFHAVVAIVIDVVLGKMKPGNRQKVGAANAAAFV